MNYKFVLFLMVLVLQFCTTSAVHAVPPERTQSSLVRFPSGRHLPLALVEDYRFSDPFQNGAGIFDRRAAEDVFVSQHFQLREFAARNSAPYLRLSPRLVECLERVRLDTGRERGPVTIVAAYRPRDGTGQGGGASPRVAEESRHVSGTGADIRYAVHGGGDLLHLANSIVTQCAPLFRGYGQDVGLGLSSTFVHVDIRREFTTWILPGAGMDGGQWRQWVEQKIELLAGCAWYAAKRSHFPCRTSHPSNGANGMLAGSQLRCVEQSWVCDGNKDCGDMSSSDELGCEHISSGPAVPKPHGHSNPIGPPSTHDPIPGAHIPSSLVPPGRSNPAYHRHRDPYGYPVVDRPPADVHRHIGGGGRDAGRGGIVQPGPKLLPDTSVHGPPPRNNQQANPLPFPRNSRRGPPRGYNNHPPARTVRQTPPYNPPYNNFNSYHQQQQQPNGGFWPQPTQNNPALGQNLGHPDPRFPAKHGYRSGTSFPHNGVQNQVGFPGQQQHIPNSFQQQPGGANGGFQSGTSNANHQQPYFPQSNPNNRQVGNFPSHQHPVGIQPPAPPVAPAVGNGFPHFSNNNGQQPPPTHALNPVIGGGSPHQGHHPANPAGNAWNNKQPFHNPPPPAPGPYYPKTTTPERSLCFPAAAKVLRKTKGRQYEEVRMEDLRIGDLVTTFIPHSSSTNGSAQFTRVIGFLDRFPAVLFKFVKIQTKSDGVFTATGDHLVFVQTGNQTSFEIMSKPVGEVTTDDKLVSSTNGIFHQDHLPTSDVSLLFDDVIAISSVWMEGAYSPLTRSGTIVVDNMLASCYGEVASHWVADMFVTPLKLWWSLFPQQVTGYVLEESKIKHLPLSQHNSIANNNACLESSMLRTLIPTIESSWPHCESPQNITSLPWDTDVPLHWYIELLLWFNSFTQF